LYCSVAVQLESQLLLSSEVQHTLSHATTGKIKILLNNSTNSKVAIYFT